ncbi:DUF4913 domain-containing protein [Micromonospora sp. NPDC050795]|uniref:DUF4913 domain-containing protein n=1 Tax=Micromonospora sp. NPDC050795 TaxID=3364282 RepID=UPI00378A87A4
MTLAETDEPIPQNELEPAELEPAAGQQPFFILYLAGHEYVEELQRLIYWVENLLIPIYGAEVTSQAPWCPRWREHPEAVAYLHGLWLAWQERTGPQAQQSDPAVWHQNHLWHTMDKLRDPGGPFAGCKAGNHRPKERPVVEQNDFLHA